MLTKILNQIYDRFGDEAYEIVENNCPNFTVCYNCRIDDFCHTEGCELIDSEEEFTRKQRQLKLKMINEKTDEEVKTELRKKHKIHISVNPYKGKWSYEIIYLDNPVDIADRVQKILDNLHNKFDSYDEALKNAIEEVLPTLK